MKEEALQVAVNQRSDSPCLVSNKKEFERQVKDYVLKDQIAGHRFTMNPKFTRKTRMGGHMSNTLKKAGMQNLGITSGLIEPIE